MFECVEIQERESRCREQVLRRTVNPSCIKKPGSFREKRSLIAIQAAKLFVEKGYHQTSIRDVSRATGMSMGNLYRYFADKEELLHLVFGRYYHRLKKILFDRIKLTQEDQDPKQALRQFISNFIARKNDFWDEMIMVNCESRFLSKSYLEEVRLQEMENIRELERILALGARRGVFKVADSYFAAVMIMHQLSILATKGWMFEGRYTVKNVDTLLEESIWNTIGNLPIEKP